MATMKEIADLAGVSRGTVDRVLNHRGSVNPATAAKIKEIVKALDYKPNRAGLVLAAQKKRLKLGVILFSAENPFYLDVLKGVQEKAKELASYNCSVLIKQIKGTVEEQLRAIDALVAEEVHGIALAPFNEEIIRQKINTLYQASIPVVTLNTDIENTHRIAYVGSHYSKSGETAAGLMHLMMMGMSELNVGIITGSSHILCHTERIRGFINALKSHNPNTQIIEVVENHDDEFESYEVTTQLLTNYPQMNALFFAAGGVYGGCRSVSSLGLAGKIRIITFDNVPTTKELVMEEIIAATICQQPELQGSKPLDILFTYLTTGELPKQEYHYVAVDIRIKENIDFLPVGNYV